MKLFTTVFSEGSVRQNQSEIYAKLDQTEQENLVLNVYPDAIEQPIMGFGGAVTESSSVVYQKLTPTAKKRFLKSCYDPEGLAYTYARCAIGSCDFSLNEYDGLNEPFSAEIDLVNDERYILPLLRDIRSVHPLQLMMAPWSPPAAWKTNDSRLEGGTLKKECWADYAAFLCHYVKAYKNEGFSVPFLSIQNEPRAIQTWDSCLFSSEDEYLFLRDFLSKTLLENGLADTKVLLYDHNKERLYDYVDDIYRHEEIRPFVGAAGYHWYSGDHFDALRLLGKKYPELVLAFTEGCNEHSNSASRSEDEKAFRYAKEISEGINAGSSLFIDWNILLDNGGGPNYAGNYCDAPIMANEKGSGIEIRFPYYALWHYSHFIEPGARALGTTRFSASVEFCAVQNPDGTNVAIIANPTKDSLDLCIRIAGQIYPLCVPSLSLNTLINSL